MNNPVHDDLVIPFAVEPLSVRGRVLRLGEALSAIVARHDYPDPVARIVGEAVTLTVLLGSSLKFDGRFQLQTKTDGPVDMIVVDFRTPDRIRAYARFDRDAVAALGSGPVATPALIGKGMLGLTIDQGAEMNRYQGIVALDGSGFEQAAQEYFRQSEQLPTRIRLAVAEIVRDGRRCYRAGGVMVQYLPSSAEQERLVAVREEEPDLWDEALAFTNTIEDVELVDPDLPSEQLLYRLFHERGVHVFAAHPVREACACSAARVLSMLKSFSAAEQAELVGEDGITEVTCEFCSRRYRFTAEDLGPAGA